MSRFISKLYNTIFGRWYIWHEDVQNPENGVAYFGPFKHKEMVDRLNDAYADLLAGSGDVEGIRLTGRDVREMYINSKAYWMHELQRIEDWSRCNSCGAKSGDECEYWCDYNGPLMHLDDCR